MSDISSEFTQGQIASFQQAFEVFDADKDGFVSSKEIFEVLSGMGNEVDDDRRRKIKLAISEVCGIEDSSKANLDFKLFMRFMKRMEQINHEEEEDRHQVEEVETEISYGCFSLRVAVNRSTNILKWALSMLFFGYNFAFFVFVSVLSLLDEDYFEQNPDREIPNSPNDFAHEYHEILKYLRWGNLANLLMVLLALTDKRRIHMLFREMDQRGHKKTVTNLLKFVFTHVFVANMAISLFYFAFLRFDRNNAQGFTPIPFTVDTIENHWRELIFPAIQIVVTFFSLSPFFYYDRLVTPQGCCQYLIVLVTDIPFYNLFRFVLTLLKNVAYLLLLVPLLFLSFLMLVCCEGPCHMSGCWFDVHKDTSRTHSFLALWAKVTA